MGNESPQISKAYDVVVIGGGHNGLVAAAYLARTGRSVLVLEKNATLGGATASQRIFPDYDALLSRYSYLVSLFPRRITDELSLNFRTKRRTTASFTPWQDSSGQARGLLLSNVDQQRSRDSMQAMTGGERAWSRYQEFLELQSQIARLVWPSLMQPLRSRASFESQLGTQQLRRAWRAFVECPLGEVIEEFAEHDALRGLIMTDGKIGVLTHPHDTRLLQNRCFLYHIIGNESGEWRVPVGGMKSLVDSLVTCCRRYGTQLITHAPATHIAIGSKQHQVTFQTEDAERCVDAEYVLVNAGSRTLANLLGTTWAPTSEDEGSVIKINMLLQRLPQLRTKDATAEEAFAGSFHIDEGYQQMQRSWASARDGIIPDPPPGEIYCHTLTDPSILSLALQQRGFHTLTLFGLDMPWRLFAADHESCKARILELYMRGLNNLCAEPIEDCLALDGEGRPCIEVKTPQELQAELDLDQGNIFHNALSWFFTEVDDQVGRWGVETAHPRIFRAGASALRGGAVSGIPGYNAAMAVLH